MIKNIKNVKLLKPEYVFSSKTIHALYLVSNSKITPENIRLKLMLSNKEIFDHSNLHLIKKEKVTFLKAKLSRLEKEYQEYLNEDRLEKYLTINFTPTKSSLNILNFIDKFEEKKLKRIEYNEDISLVFEIIYILINRDVPGNPIQYLIDNIIPNMKFNGLSNKFFIQNIL